MHVSFVVSRDSYANNPGNGFTVAPVKISGLTMHALSVLYLAGGSRPRVDDFVTDRFAWSLNR